jgi:Aromatic acid exporter family member 2
VSYALLETISISDCCRHRHLELVGNPGVGWPVAWRRWLLVLIGKSPLCFNVTAHLPVVIGSGASAIMMFIPPKSAKTAVRLAHASMIFELSQLYSLLVSTWIMAEEGAAKGEESSAEARQTSLWSKKFRSEFTKVGTQLEALRMRTSVARWEGSIRGAWPVDQYTELNEVEAEMLSYMAQVCLRRYMPHLSSI